MAYRAELVDPALEAAALVGVWTRNLQVHGDPHAKLTWQYADSPAGAAQALVLRDGDGAAVGCAGIVRRELRDGDRTVRAALLADFAVDHAHRTGLPALVLQRAVKRHVEAAFDLSYGFPNALAEAIHRRTGYAELGRIGRYVRVLRHGEYLERRFHRPLATRAAGAVVDAAKLAVRLGRALPVLRRRALVWPDDVDARWDRLWARAAPAWGLLCRRDAAFLRWRFLRRPDAACAVAALVERGSGELAAYAIVGGAPGGLAELHDLWGLPDALGDLLTLLPPALWRRGHTAVSFRFLGDPRVPALLAAHHFALRDQSRLVIVCPGPSCPIARARVVDRAAWYVTDLDEDI